MPPRAQQDKDMIDELVAQMPGGVWQPSKHSRCYRFQWALTACCTLKTDDSRELNLAAGSIFQFNHVAYIVQMSMS